MLRSLVFWRFESFCVGAKNVFFHFWLRNYCISKCDSCYSMIQYVTVMTQYDTVDSCYSMIAIDTVNNLFQKGDFVGVNLTAYESMR